MTINPHFDFYTNTAEQNLVEDLIIESIQIYGIDIKYMPKSFVNKDFLFGEDVLAKFENAYDVEVYIKNTDSFEGDHNLISKFGLEIRDQTTLTMSQKRWRDVIGQHVDNVRPHEGDLLFFPLNSKIFEILYVNFESLFYQLGKLPVYDLTCELLEYSSQRLETGNTEIDDIEDDYSLAQVRDSANNLVDPIYDDTPDMLEGNKFFEQFENQDDSDEPDIVDFSETNPFGDSS